MWESRDWMSIWMTDISETIMKSHEYQSNDVHTYFSRVERKRIGFPEKFSGVYNSVSLTHATISEQKVP